MKTGSRLDELSVPDTVSGECVEGAARAEKGDSEAR